jgi:hypothetical protein
MQTESGIELPTAAWSLLGYTPNGWQLKHIHTRHERFVVGCTCRQCGKSTGMAAEIHAAMTQPPDKSGEPPLVGVMAVDFPRAELPVLRWYEWYKRTFGDDAAHVNMNQHYIRLPNGAMLRWFSAEAPLGAAGYTFNRFFFDESQWISNEAFTKTRPAFNAKEARVTAFGTPDTAAGNTWFRGLYQRGQDADDPDVYSFRVNVWKNDYITFDEIVAMRADMTDDEFRMLALAQWVNTGGYYFRKFRHCFTGEFENKANGGPYIMGADIAKRRDFTVLYVYDVARNAVVAKQRFNGMPYDEVEGTIEDLYRHYNCQFIHMDVGGPGDPLLDYLRKKHIAVRPFTFTNQSKAKILSNLKRMLEQGQIILPATDTQLIRELEVFETKQTASGNIQYLAPDTYFDDSIMALALCAAEGRRQSGGGLRTGSWVGRQRNNTPDWFKAIR